MTALPKEEMKKKIQFKTVTKYTFYESGSKWCKVLIPDFAGLKDAKPPQLTIKFEKRSFTVTAEDHKGQNLSFAVPKLQCRINPELCTVTHKSGGL